MPDCYTRFDMQKYSYEHINAVLWILSYIIRVNKNVSTFRFNPALKQVEVWASYKFIHTMCLEKYLHKQAEAQLMRRMYVPNHFNIPTHSYA